MESSVIKFLEREDNSRVIPGKQDYKLIRKTDQEGNVHKEKVQKRILNDYMKNLCQKLLAEYPYQLVSRGLFCAMRPEHLVPIRFASRDTCLCTGYQNVALKLKSLHNSKVVSTCNPDLFIRVLPTEKEIKGVL